MAKVTFTSAGDMLCAYLVGEIDHHSATLLRDEIDNAIMQHGPATTVLDFGGVSFMDSSGVGLILGRAKQMTALEGRLVVQHAPEQLKKLLDIAGVQYV